MEASEFDRPAKSLVGIIRSVGACLRIGQAHEDVDVFEAGFLGSQLSRCDRFFRRSPPAERMTESLEGSSVPG